MVTETCVTVRDETTGVFLRTGAEVLGAETIVLTADEKKQLLIAIHDHSKPMNPRKIRQLNIGV